MTGFLRVNQIGKSYKQYRNRWSRLLEWITVGKISSYCLRWVLQDISFEVRSGEAVGIIGRNGAGKSTLLKLIAGTTRPTQGSIEISGRVAALLELGMGFHPEFTGRQNVFIAGQLLGYTKQEIQENFAFIEEFADIGEYMDRPIRIYSSGMQVRLAFSVATAIRPDILIVDEALSVGDVYFQQKCFDRIGQFKKLGTTLLFVSHDLTAINNICDRAIFIKNGAIAFDGKPNQVLNLYEADFLKKIDAKSERLEVQQAVSATTTNQFGSLHTNTVNLLKVEILSSEGLPIDTIISDTEITLSISVLFLEEFDDPHVGFKVRDRIGAVIFETNSYCMKHSIGAVQKNSVITTNFKFKASLIAGDYTITVGVANEGYSGCEFKEILAHCHGVGKLTVLKNHDAIIWAGIYNLSPDFSVIVN